MKGNIKFIIFIVVLMAVAFLIEFSLPRKFTWNPTFDTRDKEPFGSYVFDDVCSSSLKNGYSVAQKTFYLFDTDSLADRLSVLSVTNHQNFSTNEVRSILQFVEKGNKVMLVSSFLNHYLSDTLNIDDKWPTYFNLNTLQESILKNVYKRDTLVMCDSTFKKKDYSYFPQIANGYFRKGGKARFISTQAQQIDSILQANPDIDVNIDSILIETTVRDTIPVWADSLERKDIVCNKDGESVAICFKIGQGELFIVSNPLTFTNYGMLDNENAGYIFSLLSYIDDFPVVRTESHSPRNRNSEQTPLRYFISQKALKWCIYLTLATIILFMIFTAKRRQRIIPVINPPANRTLEFIRLIGTLYFQRKDYTDLTRKKYIYFSDQLKRNTHIDIEAEELSAELAGRLSEKTGMNSNSLYALLSRLKAIMNGDKVSEQEMKDLIDRMNDVLNKSR